MSHLLDKLCDEIECIFYTWDFIFSILNTHKLTSDIQQHKH